MTLNLHEKALTCAKNYKRCELELLNILGLIDQDNTYLAFGVSSLFRYCVEILKLSEADTMKFIQVTRKAALIPELKTAIENGDITTTKAARISSVITPGNHLQWIETAKLSTHRELEREVASANPVPHTVHKIKPLDAEYSELKLTISKELQQKLEQVQKILNTSSIHDALEKSLDHILKKKDPLAKAERSLNNLHRTCDVAKVVTSSLVTTNKNSRVLPAHTKHKVFLRDRGRCTFKNCGSDRFIQIHHRKPVSQGGTHELTNLMTLCHAHHRMLHAH